MTTRDEQLRALVAELAEPGSSFAASAERLRIRVQLSRILETPAELCDCYDDGVMPVLGPACKRNGRCGPRQTEPALSEDELESLRTARGVLNDYAEGLRDDGLNDLFVLQSKQDLSDILKRLTPPAQPEQPEPSEARRRYRYNGPPWALGAPGYGILTPGDIVRVLSVVHGRYEEIVGRAVRYIDDRGPMCCAPKWRTLYVESIDGTRRWCDGMFALPAAAVFVDRR